MKTTCQQTRVRPIRVVLGNKTPVCLILLLLASVSFLTECRRVSNRRLRNTIWESELISTGVVDVRVTLTCGNRNFRLTYRASVVGASIPVSETGTYRVAGETVRFTGSNQRRFTGTLIGKSMILDGLVNLEGITIGEIELRRVE